MAALFIYIFHMAWSNVLKFWNFIQGLEFLQILFQETIIKLAQPNLLADIIHFIKKSLQQIFVRTVAIIHLLNTILGGKLVSSH